MTSQAMVQHSAPSHCIVCQATPCQATAQHSTTRHSTPLYAKLLYGTPSHVKLRQHHAMQHHNRVTAFYARPRHTMTSCAKLCQAAIHHATAIPLYYMPSYTTQSCSTPRQATAQPYQAAPNHNTTHHNHVTVLYAKPSHVMLCHAMPCQASFLLAGWLATITHHDWLSSLSSRYSL